MAASTALRELITPQAG